MNTLQLEHILKDVEYFRGVYPADKLPALVNKICKRYKSEPSCFISNTQSSLEPGEHWVAFYIPAPQSRAPGAAADDKLPIEFFDSFGFHSKFSFVRSEYFHNFVEKLKQATHKSVINLKINLDQLQDIDSALCGYYCVVYVFFKCRKRMQMNAILKKLHGSTATAVAAREKKKKKEEQTSVYKRNDLNVMNLFRKHVWHDDDTVLSDGGIQREQYGGTRHRRRFKIIQTCIPMSKCM